MSIELYINNTFLQNTMITNWKISSTWDRKLRKFSSRFEIFLNKIIFNKVLNNYPNKYISKKINKKWNILEINLSFLARFDPILYFNIIQSPGAMVTLFDVVINRYYLKNKFFFFDLFKKKDYFFDDKAIKIQLTGRIISNLNAFVNPEPKFLNKLQTVEGFVVQVGTSVPDLIGAFFKCEICCFETYSFIENGIISEPTYCFRCKNFNSFQILYDRCQFNDKKFIKVKEFKSNIEKSLLKQTINLMIPDQLIEEFTIGEEIIATGIYRLTQIYHKNNKYQSSLLENYLEVLSIKKQKQTNRIFDLKSFKFKSTNFCKVSGIGKRNIKFNSLGQNSKIYKILAYPIMQETYGIDPLKKGFLNLLVNLFSNKDPNNKIFSQSNLNLLINEKDKSDIKFAIFKFLKSYDNKAPCINSINIEKENLFFSIFKDEISYIPKIKKGLLLQSKKNILCIDNFDNLSSEFSSMIEEIINYGALSISKAGLVCRIKSCFSLIGITHGKNKKTNIVKKKNSNYNQNLFSLENFDLIYNIKNLNSEFFDKKFAEHLIDSTFFKMSYGKREKEKSLGIGMKITGLKKILNSIKNIKISILSEFSCKEISRLIFFLKKVVLMMKVMTKFGYENKIKTLIALSKTICKLRFSNVVGIEDIRHAFVCILESILSYRQ